LWKIGGLDDGLKIRKLKFLKLKEGDKNGLLNHILLHRFGFFHWVAESLCHGQLFQQGNEGRVVSHEPVQ
jgi:hypothetical protein